MVVLTPFLFISVLLFAQSSSPVPEYRVKATFLYQFTQFVDWPRGAFPSDQTPLVIGILGDDPFGTFLDETVRDEKANAHSVVIQRYRNIDEVKECQILFVSRLQAGRIREIGAALKGRYILTVGDADGFAERGGVIEFVTQENRIRLRINLGAAKAANLTISSKLLRPATVIDQGAR